MSIDPDTSPQRRQPGGRSVVVGASALVLVWLSLLFGTTFVASYARAGHLIPRVAGLVYLAGSRVCHQRAERSFHLSGVQMPVCARCTGIYAGAAIAALGMLVVATRRRGRQAHRKTGRKDRLWLIGAALPTALSVGLEATGVWGQTLVIRAVTGAPLGLAVGWFVLDHALEVVDRLSTAASGPARFVRRAVARMVQWARGGGKAGTCA